MAGAVRGPGPPDPDAPAVLHEGTALSYAELDARANRLARLLIRSGARPETLVALALPRSVDIVVVQVAVGKAGAAFLPVDPGYPADPIAFTRWGRIACKRASAGWWLAATVWQRCLERRTAVPRRHPFYGAGVGLTQQQLLRELRQARAAAVLAFGGLQAQLMRELLTRMQANGAPAEQTVPVQASLDQLDASVRELKARVADAAGPGTTTHAMAHTAAVPGRGEQGACLDGRDG